MKLLLSYLIFLFALVACAPAAGEATSSTLDAVTYKLPANLVAVPLVRQQQDFSCGDVATLAVLRYWKHAEYKNVLETALYAPLHTSRTDGTDPQPIADYLNGVDGVTAEYKTQDDGVDVRDLEEAIDRGEPAIVDIQAWQDVRRVGDLKPWGDDWDDGHYVVLVGYDRERFYFMDPSTSGHYAFIPREELAERWHDTVGTDDVHTQRMVIFVRSTTTPWISSAPPPPRASPIH